jgi:hypothetical protein
MSDPFDVDYLLFAPLYDDDTLASDAMLTTADGAQYSLLPDGTTLRVIDQTAGTAVQEAARGGRIAVETIRPTARLRQTDLALLGLALTDLENGELTIQHDGRRNVTWSIKAYQVKPTPTGPGEVELILSDRDED